MYENGEYLLDMARFDISGMVQKLFMSGDDRITAAVSWNDIQKEIERLLDVAEVYPQHIVTSATRAEICGGYTVYHSINVSILSMYIAMLMGKERKEVIATGIAGILHDIGKKYISGAVLEKSVPLSKEETEVFRMHPKLGHDLIASRYPEAPQVVLDGIYQHHEKLTGTGYPEGIKEISETARIIQVADIFEAYTAVRPYHSSRPIHDGIAFIKKEEGIDKDIVEIFSMEVLNGLDPVNA